MNITPNNSCKIKKEDDFNGNKKQCSYNLFLRAQNLKQKGMFSNPAIGKRGEGTFLCSINVNNLMDSAMELLKRSDSETDISKIITLIEALIIYTQATLRKEGSHNIVQYYRTMINIADRIINENKHLHTKLEISNFLLFIYSVRMYIMFALTDKISTSDTSSNNFKYYIHNISIIKQLDKKIRDNNSRIKKLEDFLPYFKKQIEDLKKT